MKKTNPVSLSEAQKTLEREQDRLKNEIGLLSQRGAAINQQRRREKEKEMIGSEEVEEVEEVEEKGGGAKEFFSWSQLHTLKVKMLFMGFSCIMTMMTLIMLQLPIDPPPSHLNPTTPHHQVAFTQLSGSGTYSSTKDGLMSVGDVMRALHNVVPLRKFLGSANPNPNPNPNANPESLGLKTDGPLHEENVTCPTCRYMYGFYF